MSAKRQWKGNTGGNLLGQNALILLFRLLDVRVGYAAMALIVPFYMLFARKGYKAIYRYYRRRWQMSPWRSFINTYRNHYRFGQVILDRFAVYAGRRDCFNVEIEGNEHFSRLTAGEKGFIIAGSHVGNFEICGYLLNPEPKTINALVFAGETRTVSENRARVLTPHNVRLIPVLDDMSHIFAINDALRHGQIVSMPCDRSAGSAKSVECDFLGAKADFPAGPFTLARTFDVEILALFAVKTAALKYKIYVMPLGAENSAAEYAERLQTIVNRYPDQWFNFYEFWKP
ncbi:MAG: lipid A biosynthesis (KDO)2-(lauroyl)-lipid IVA acyltransferase [Tannerella sp.]|jgi:predicted LPLAT superfamily acyltransferase|nr:lipid A biosynthesis (KDO)2-(lauroyl)-lipid IVA acyltransferase [Tannerella sp.]